MVVASRKVLRSGTPLFDFFDKLNSDKPPEPIPLPKPLFPGKSFDPKLDWIRLSKLQYAIFNLMRDGNWRTHSEIKKAIKQGSENGIAAMLRNLRHSSRGSHRVEKRRRGDPKQGLFEYKLVVNNKTIVLSKAKEKL